MKNTTKLLWSVLALACCSIMPISVYAEQTDQTVTSEGTYTASVTMQNASTFNLQIPKTISIKDKSGNYQIAVSGDIASNQRIKIVPDASFVMKQSGKSDKTATITQEKQVVVSAEIEDGSFVTIPGSIAAPEATAGTWNGKFNFNISLEVDPIPPDTDTMIYRLESLDPDINYQEIDANSRNMTTAYGGTLPNDLVIPVAYKDGETWYKVTSIGDMAFHRCRNLTSIVIPDSVTIINGSTFMSCSNLTSIEIPDSVTSIGDDAFRECSSLTSIVIPDSVTSIGNATFASCSSLTSIEIPDGITIINGSTFSGCSSLTSIVIPDGVTSIGYQTFMSCSNLTSIEIPDSVTSIGSYTFYGCSNLTSIEIPDGVISIRDSAFRECSSLTSIEIPDSVTSIGNDAFLYCSNLTSITFRGTMEQWNAITKVDGWNEYTGNYTIHCTDGEI